MENEGRLDRMEYQLRQVTSRLRRLEMDAEVLDMPDLPPNFGQSPPTDAAPPPEEPSGPEPRQESPAAITGSDYGDWARSSSSATIRSGAVTAVDLEQLFGGRVLAWIGGLAILLGAVLFVGMSMSSGWLDEEARTIIAAVLSLALLGGGVWLHESKGRTDAAAAAVASALAGLFGTIVVATQAYSLIAPEVGLAAGALVAALGFGIAVRWQSPLIAALGSLGALGAPVLVGTGTSGVSIAFVALALAATVAILVWQRWDWLALGAFVVSVPQLVAWAFENPDGHLALVAAVLLGFWAIYVVGALGYELRSRREEMLPVASWFLLLASGAITVAVGFIVLNGHGHHTAAVEWVLGLAALHIALGGLALRLGIHREVGSVLIGLGIAISAFGLAEALDGPALVAAWAAAGAVLAYLATRLDATPDPALSGAERMVVAAAAFLALAFTHTLAIEAPLRSIVDGVDNLGAALGAIGACAAAALTAGYFTRQFAPTFSRIVAFVGAAALVYLGSVLIIDTIGIDAAGETRQAGQAWLSVFWSVTGLGAVIWGLVRKVPNVRFGGLALLALAIAKVWTYDLSELDELSRVLSFIGLGLLLLIGAFAYQRIKPVDS
jgi:uncharacterized membrane protein